jgi:hypothetical protein
MPLSIPPASPTAAGTSATASNEASRSPRSPFADAFAEARNDPNCVVFDMRRGARQLKQTPAAQIASAPPTEEQQRRDIEKQLQRDEDFRIFTELCVHIGLASINHVFTGKALALDCRNVIGKMENSGNNLSRAKDGTTLPDRIKIIGSQHGLQSIATAMSNEARSKNSFNKFYLGLGMTMAHVKKLHNLSKNPSPANTVKIGKFLLVGKERITEVNSAKESAKDQTQVVLEINGFSNKNLRSHMMFGPHATFQVDAVGPGSRNTDVFIVRLTEIAENKHAANLLS